MWQGQEELYSAVSSLAKGGVALAKDDELPTEEQDYRNHSEAQRR